jgi:chromosome segregation ATPase
MFNLQGLSKAITQAVKPMTSENKSQASAIADIGKLLAKTGGGGGAMAKATKEIASSLQKITKLIDAQTTLLDGIKAEDLIGDGKDDEAAEMAKELEAEIKKITDENKKQAAEIEKILAEVEKAKKDAGDDKDAGKKIKAATAALEKAVKLIDEQSKLLEEAKKALAG